MSQNPRRDSKVDEAIPVSIPMKPNSTDNAWKIVGSPSRRGSLATTQPMTSTSPAASPTPNAMEIPNSSNNHSNNARRPSVDTQWGSFGGLQWEGPGIFEHQQQQQQQQHPSNAFIDDVPPYATAPSLQQHRPSFTYENNSILSVPMLPSVSLEPIYRQQRSLSFSVGQDPYAYDDEDPHAHAYNQQHQQHQHQHQPQHPYAYPTQPQQPPLTLAQQQQQQQQFYKSSLATMKEELQEEDDMLHDLLLDDELSAARWRSRSQSSGAAFSLLSPSQQAALLNPASFLRRGSTDAMDDLLSQRRRSSRFFDQSIMSMGDKERLESIQRRLSQTPSLPPNDYQFPPDPSFLAQQRRSSLTQHPMQQLTEQLEGTHLSSSAASFSPRYPQMMPTNATASSREEYFDAEHQQQQLQTMNTGVFRDMGKGIPLPRLPSHAPLYAVEFKAGRTDYFYVVNEPGVRAAVRFQPGDLVIVEGDRGKDLGKVASDILSVDTVEKLVQAAPPPVPQHLQADQGQHDDHLNSNNPGGGKKDVHIKRLYRLAAPDEINLLMEKSRDEMHALALCQQKTRQRNLPMTVVDAEYQWDRRKLTFFFNADRRIDFRDLVRELFKIYKTRIWMCAVPIHAPPTFSSPPPPAVAVNGKITTTPADATNTTALSTTATTNDDSPPATTTSSSTSLQTPL
ncbi:PSP1 C-terminal conserved region-domain-containing protein [Gongronella butleri]|nr:PSP1 C-terminal conserved region-domain-containing protein [Gongronella butleri]